MPRDRNPLGERTVRRSVRRLICWIPYSYEVYRPLLPPDTTRFPWRRGQAGLITFQPDHSHRHVDMSALAFVAAILLPALPGETRLTHSIYSSLRDRCEFAGAPARHYRGASREELLTVSEVLRSKPFLIQDLQAVSKVW